MASRLALDANILLLLAYGTVNKDSLGKKRRVKEYMPDDYEILCKVASRFQQIVVTPNVVTECSDLFSDNDDYREKEWLKAFLGSNESLRIEQYVPSKDAASLEQYRYLGIADCSLLSLIDDNTVLLTTDSKLYLAAAMLNPRCMNFNHLRSFA